MKNSLQETIFHKVAKSKSASYARLYLLDGVDMNSKKQSFETMGMKIDPKKLKEKGGEKVIYMEDIKGWVSSDDIILILDKYIKVVGSGEELNEKNATSLLAKIQNWLTFGRKEEEEKEEENEGRIGQKKVEIPEFYWGRSIHGWSGFHEWSVLLLLLLWGRNMRRENFDTGQIRWVWINSKQ